MANKRRNPVNQDFHGVKEDNGKFICEACGSVLKMDHDCPECGQKINWGRAVVEFRRGSTGV